MQVLRGGQRKYAFERDAMTVKRIEEAHRHETKGKVSPRPGTIAF
jgi:hypothetical protein